MQQGTTQKQLYKRVIKVFAATKYQTEWLAFQTNTNYCLGFVQNIFLLFSSSKHNYNIQWYNL